MKTPAVRRLVIAYGISALGSAMVAAIAFVAYRKTKSVVLTVAVLGANAVPALVLSTIVGKIATRSSERESVTCADFRFTCAQLRLRWR